VRLGACFLTGAVLAAPLSAEGHPLLAWERQPPLDWQAGSRATQAIPTAPEPSTGPVMARLAADGTLKVSDAQGVIRLHAGLPGRPLKAWRDGGIALAQPSGLWAFPADSPLSKGLGGLRWCSDDFRPFLRGLLWILDDGEGFLTVVHPATARLIHLPLPPGEELDLHFFPDRLEVVAGKVVKGAPRQWSIPWMGLLPRLAGLGPRPDPSKAGTALSPFPNN
jgi:hypothetical protein